MYLGTIRPYKQGDGNALQRFANAIDAWAKGEK